MEGRDPVSLVRDPAQRYQHGRLQLARAGSLLVDARRGRGDDRLPPDTDANAATDPDAHTTADADSSADPDAVTGPHPDAEAHAYANAAADANADSRSGFIAEPHARSDATFHADAADHAVTDPDRPANAWTRRDLIADPRLRRSPNLPGIPVRRRRLDTFWSRHQPGLIRARASHARWRSSGTVAAGFR
jgi:hypothetical protein